MTTPRSVISINKNDSLTHFNMLFFMMIMMMLVTMVTMPRCNIPTGNPSPRAKGRSVRSTVSAEGLPT